MVIISNILIKKRNNQETPGDDKLLTMESLNKNSWDHLFFKFNSLIEY